MAKVMSWFIPLLIVLVVGAYFVINTAQKSVADLPILGEVPKFTFTNQHSKPFSQENLKGKITVVDFIFTNCHGPCPIMSANMAELYRLSESTDKIQFVSISVDPERDTIETLLEYSKNFDVNDNRWQFLYSEIEGVKELCEGGFMLAADDLPGNHSTKFIMVDQLGLIRGYYDGTDEASINILKTHLRQLLSEIE